MNGAGITELGPDLNLPMSPVAFGTFKVTALLIAMFFAIKWHYDQGEKQGRQAVLRASAKITVAFVVALVAVGFVAYAISSMLGLNLSY